MLGSKLIERFNFWAQKLSENYDFCAQKHLISSAKILGLETEIMAKESLWVRKRKLRNPSLLIILLGVLVFLVVNNMLEKIFCQIV